uniref:Chaperone protein dnaJ n=1 Tax=Rhizophora mucronata TaxID=61149 RepID=A0A2P2KKT1_RHIMU
MVVHMRSCHVSFSDLRFSHYPMFSGELKATKVYQKWAKQVSETKPPIISLRRKAKSNQRSEDLLAIISQRRSQRKDHFESMFSSLVFKYGGSSAAPEPTEEEFEAAQKNLESRNPSKKLKRK